MRGARPARRLALIQRHDWGIPSATPVSDAVGTIVAELAANAVTHGRVPGRDFELALSLVAGSVRVEVTGIRADASVDVRKPRPLEEAGRGLVLVGALADRWEVVDRQPPPGKTVRAEVDVPGWLGLVLDLDAERQRSGVSGRR
ncbi:hypothetical protein DI272_34065 [Streptomyces sp. Act143]|uniref:ATP-binding protein n=1 Tax=Streptomyces sp. Act143 TaxID=2200760 RepID=UPI000D676500|nr:ATP-binding protein [Streptomyces sp. Act143]PWI18604.1 hypothetical protein DI272_34065 [Streptomyces sp. Act143]